MRIVRWGSVLALLLVPSLVLGGADPAAPIPPALPGAVADAQGLTAVVAEDGGGIAGLDLSTGQTRWRSVQGRWPLASADGWVAVAAPDSADRRLLRVRFLSPADGRLLVEARPIPLPAMIGAQASWEGEGLSLGTGNTSVHLAAWATPGPARNARAAQLRLRWQTRSFTGGGGMRPPEPGPTSAGMALVDPASGAIEVRPDEPAQGPEPRPPGLPPRWKPAPGTIYWSWSWFGSAWSDKPRTFWIGGAGMAGFFSYESATRRLMLNRLRPPEPLPAVELAAGGEWAPQVSTDGRYLILSRGNAGVETFTFYDLLGSGKTAAPIPWSHLEPRFRWPFSVLGPSLYYVAEGEGRGVTGGTAFPRWLVCVEWRSGKIRWTHPLPPRFLSAPMAGASPGLPR